VDDNGAPPTLAGRLDHLFSVHRGSNGREPTYREVATAIADRGGPTVSPSYIWQLRTGLKDNPTLKHLEALASYFKVDPAYFFDADTADRIDEHHALSAAVANQAVREVALAAANLMPDSLATVRTVIDRIAALERNVDKRPTRTVTAGPRRKRGGASASAEEPCRDSNDPGET